ncbi:hypothetical protein ACR82Z_03590 [Mycoplasma sp. 6243]|uniref:hypothetical protein n=1 Tax=Mycoplasma sp. 6243 TaxID=3440865 RepID=UPI003EB99D77
MPLEFYLGINGGMAGFILLILMPTFILLYIIRYQYPCFIIEDVYKRDIKIKSNEYHITFINGWNKIQKYIYKIYKELLYIVSITSFLLIVIFIYYITNMVLYQKEGGSSGIWIFQFLSMLVIPYSAFMFVFYVYIKGFLFSKKSLRHFELRVKQAIVIEDQPLLDASVYFNNGLKPNNYIYIPRWFFDDKVRLLRVSYFKKTFKTDAQDVYAFFIYKMHESFRKEHVAYYHGLYFDYVNFNN